MERETSARPLSTRPPSAVPIPRTAAMISTASRPITQQGLSGLRPTQTSGGVVNRIYHDKRYWMSLIQTQMNKLRDEMARIKKENEDYRMKTLNIEDLKKTAQDHAKKIEEQQELLSVYNSALEMHMNKTKEDEIVAETEQIKRQNEVKFKEIDNLFNEKVRLQEKIAKVKKELEEKDGAMQKMVEQLSEEDREQYYSLAAENEKVVKAIQNMQAEIKESKEKINNYKEIINKSPEKQELLQLLQTQHRLETQKKELTAFLNNSMTPAQQREALLQQVKQDKSDSEALAKLRSTLEEELARKRARLAELERELDGKDSARLKKHRELRERGEHMDTFIGGYEEKAAGIRSKIETSRDQVVLALDHIAGNIAELDLEEFGNVQIDSGEQTLDAWNKRCSLLSSQLQRLKTYKQKYEMEVVNLKEKQMLLRREIDDFQDVERKREELSLEKSNLLAEETALKAKLESTEAAVFEIRRQKADIVKRLEENPAYHEVVTVEKEIEEVENKQRDVEEILKYEMKNNVVEELNSTVDELLRKRNEQLIANLKQKKK